LKKRNKDNIVMTIDSGTQGLRVILFDDCGNELGKNEIRYKDYYSKKHQWKEASGDMFWNAIIEGIQSLKIREPRIFDQIKGVTIACQRDIMTVVDENGEPLRDFISWLDRRTIDNQIQYPLVYRLLFKLVGFSEFAKSFSMTTHAHWIKFNEPKIWRKAHKVVFLSTFLIAKLSGKIMDSRSSTVGHVAFDYKNKEWCKTYDVKSKLIQIEPEKYYDLVDSCEIIGFVSEKAAKETGLPVGLPIVASGTDKGCETVGVGAIIPSVASVSLGTQSTVEITSKKYLELFPFYPSFCGVEPDAYNPEVTIYHGFWMIEWFINEFLSESDSGDVYDVLDSYLLKTQPGANGLIHQPYWGREAFRPEARGAFIGFSEGHHKEDIYRGIIEGLGFALLEGIEVIESKSKITIKEIGLSGGGSRSDLISQIMADIFNRKVYRVQTYETTGLGGAMACFVGLKRFENISEAKESMVRKSKVFEPNPEHAIIYNDIYTNIYKKLYSRLKPLYKKIKITN
jgi:sugar (pentulose or hexulose) kinase